MTRNIYDLYRLILKHNWRVIKAERQQYPRGVGRTIIEVWIEPPPPHPKGSRYMLLDSGATSE